jgi:uncharacterized protein (TIGR02271 family)
MTSPARHDPPEPADDSIRLHEEPELEETLELREEQLVAHKELRELGDVLVHTQVEEVPGRLEVDAYHEEVDIEHEPVGQAVSERKEPWEEDGTLVVPVYEEQLVVSKRLILKERLRIRRIGTTERQLFQDTLRRERLVVEDPAGSGLVHERYPMDANVDTDSTPPSSGADEEPQPGLLEHIVRKALE